MIADVKLALHKDGFILQIQTYNQQVVHVQTSLGTFKANEISTNQGQRN